METDSFRVLLLHFFRKFILSTKMFADMCMHITSAKLLLQSRGPLLSHKIINRKCTHGIPWECVCAHTYIHAYIHTYIYRGDTIAAKGVQTHKAPCVIREQSFAIPPTASAQYCEPTYPPVVEAAGQDRTALLAAR